MLYPLIGANQRLPRDHAKIKANTPATSAGFFIGKPIS